MVMALQGRLTVITGGSGTVGGGIVKRFLQEGAVVIAPLRSEASKSKLESALQGTQLVAASLHTPLADWGTEEGAEKLAEYVRHEAGGVVDHVVSISGGAVPMGLVSALDPEEMMAALRSRLAGHLLLARHVFPLLRQDVSSSYTIVTGAAGETLPAPNMALLAMCNGAAYGLVLGVQAEKRDSPCRINEMRIAAVICRDNADNAASVT